MINITQYDTRRSNVGFCYFSKGRDELTQRTLMALLEEKEIDVYWISGDEAEGGPYWFVKSMKEIHNGVDGGADVAFRYGMKLLLSKGYEYCGFLENDILLEKDWFKCFELFKRGQKDGLDVAAVSPRCIEDRILIPHYDYAVMGNAGAGCTILTRDSLLDLALDKYRPFYHESRFYLDGIQNECKNITGLDYPVSARVKLLDPNVTGKWSVSCDWAWEVILWNLGKVVLAPTPSMARNIDEEGMKDTVMQSKGAVVDNDVWQAFVSRLRARQQPVKIFPDKAAVRAVSFYA